MNDVLNRERYRAAQMVATGLDIKTVAELCECAVSDLQNWTELYNEFQQLDPESCRMLSDILALETLIAAAEKNEQEYLPQSEERRPAREALQRLKLWTSELLKKQPRLGCGT